jgi:hypothetical protein
MKMQTQTLELLVDGIPYEVKVTPYEFNTEPRFKISYNGSPEYIFVYDTDLKRLTAIGDDAGVIPANLEESISGHVLSAFA